MTQTTTHTVKLDERQSKMLHDEVRRQRMATGDDVSKAEVLRQALEHYLGKK